MLDFISRLLGLESKLGAGSDSTLRLLASWRPLWMLAILVAVLAYYTWQYAQDARRIKRGQRWVLTALRLAVVVVVLLMLLKPALNIKSVEERPPVVAVLVDESTSMAYPEASDSPLVDRAGDRVARSRFAAAREAATRLIEKMGLNKDHRVVVYKFSGTTEPIAEIPFSRDPQGSAVAEAMTRLRAALVEPAGVHSDPGEALMDVTRRLKANAVSGLVLVTDGRATGTAESGAVTLTEAAERLREQHLPVYTIGTGTAEPLRDLALTDLAAPQEANLDDVLTMRVTVVNHIAPGLETTFTLLENDQPKVIRKVRLASGRNDIMMSTIAKGPKEGERKYTIAAPRYEDEWTYDNNQITAHVNIVKRTLRCLLIAGVPTVEYHYLWPALVRDPIINVSTWLQDADVNYLHQGNVVIERLPETLEEWNRYDVVILYDLDPARFTNEQENGLEHLIRKGGGLMVIAGRTHGLDTLLTVRTAKMAAMLPVEIDRNKHPDYTEVLDRPMKVARTRAGREHPVFLFDMNPATNDDVWKSFPEVYWAHPTMGLKAQAVSLLEKDAPGLDPDGKVLMAIWRYGEGAVFYNGIHALWRWRYPFENYDHDRFFSQIVRYLGETRLLGAQKQVVLSTDRKLYTPGADATITLSVLDPALLAQLRNEAILATVTDAQGAEFKVPLLLPDPRRQTFVGTYRPRNVGTCTVRCDHTLAEGTSDQKKVFDETTHFEVRLQSLEELDPTADLPALAQLAETTGGLAFDHRTMDRLGDLPGALSKEPQRVIHRAEEDIWDSPLFWLIAVGLVSTEWVLRKKWSLL